MFITLAPNSPFRFIICYGTIRSFFVFIINYKDLNNTNITIIKCWSYSKNYDGS